MKKSEMQEIISQQTLRIQELEMLRDLRVPRRDHDEALKSLSVCQATIERLMIELAEKDPKNREVADASVILGLLEGMIGWNKSMQDDLFVATEKAKAEAIRAERMKHVDKFIQDRNSFEKKYFGEIKREIK